MYFKETSTKARFSVAMQHWHKWASDHSTTALKCFHTGFQPADIIIDESYTCAVIFTFLQTRNKWFSLEMLSYKRFALTKYLQNLPHFGMCPNMAERTENVLSVI